MHEGNKQNVVVALEVYHDELTGIQAEPGGGLALTAGQTGQSRCQSIYY